MPADASPRIVSDSQPANLIGVFDSGVGGLSVLRALRQALPSAPLLYVADSANAPYGERSDAFIADRSQRIASHLLAQGAQMLVVACNTATAVAVASLRERWLELPVVAVEPGIKPAVAASRNGRIGVMATPATLRSDKFLKLLTAHGAGAQVNLIPCPGLAALIEQGHSQDAAISKLLETLCAPLVEAKVDTVVLGCTHYPFVSAQIQAALGRDVQLIDTADAVARQAVRLFAEKQLQSSEASQETAVRLQTTGNVEHLKQLAQNWLPFDCVVSPAVGL